ncbi:MAG: hypothetical protein HFH98_12520 [Lachnospiraceae bacterium]|jgi:hypothetical protein|nr:hypothetical protein [uncultured Acetatifactor sp.]MCI9652661.1 hypothetical protein [Lachnospiraceae bacterium]
MAVEKGIEDVQDGTLRRSMERESENEKNGLIFINVCRNFWAKRINCDLAL